MWITPCYKSPMVDNGYDVQDYYDIDPSFGTMEDMDELIARGRERGIRVVMDLVFNHTSDQCAWFLESRKPRATTNTPTGTYGATRARTARRPTNWRSIFGGSAWEWCEERGQYYLHTFAKQQPDLNWENPEVRKALFDIANFWADKGVGGFRIDAITYIKKPAVFADGPADGEDGLYPVHAATANQPGILDFLHEFKAAVRDGRDIFMVGEANGVAAHELDQWVGEKGVFDMLFEFSHTHVPMGEAEIWCRPVTWKLTDLKRALAASQEATRTNGWYPAFFENHDQPRSTVNFFRCEGPLARRPRCWVRCCSPRAVRRSCTRARSWATETPTGRPSTSSTTCRRVRSTTSPRPRGSRTPMRSLHACASAATTPARPCSGTSANAGFLGCNAVAARARRLRHLQRGGAGGGYGARRYAGIAGLLPAYVETRAAGGRSGAAPGGDEQVMAFERTLGMRVR